MGTQSTSIAWERTLAKTVAELAAALNITPVHKEWTTVTVDRICTDSREAAPGDLFVGIPGTHRDGAEYAWQATQRGAIAVMAERDIPLPIPVLRVPCARQGLARASAAFYGYPTRTLFTVGVTGTNGKTTTCHWIADILGSDCTALSSTVSNAATDATSLTTPPSPVVQRMARNAADGGGRHFVVEASSAGIAQHRVDDVDFDVAVFTNFSPEHLRYHHGLDAYRRAKLSLFESLKTDAWAVLNADDPLSATIARITPARVLTYGRSRDADLKASDVREDATGYRFAITEGKDASRGAALRWIGPYNVSNAMAAIAVGRVSGLPLHEAVDRLATVQSVPGRGQAFHRGDGVTVIVDFAHNAASLEALLRFLRGRYERILAVYGCPGDGEHEKRRAMGAISERLCDRIILTSDNPKHESPRAIAEEIRSGVVGGRVPVSIVLRRKDAIEQAVKEATPRDVVLLAGKGHEAVQLVGDRRMPFSDAGVLETLGFEAR